MVRHLFDVLSHLSILMEPQCIFGDLHQSLRECYSLRHSDRCLTGLISLCRQQIFYIVILLQSHYRCKPLGGEM